MKSAYEIELENKVKQLEKDLMRFTFDSQNKSAVSVPEQFKPIFDKAQESVHNYFKNLILNPSHGTITIGDQRYVLIRAAALSIDFIDTIKALYADRGKEEVTLIGNDILFDISHSIGINDAKNFHEKMDLKDPISKLSAGPIHFAYSGWAYVDILPASNPSPDDNFFLIYNHPFSFESDSWIKAGKKSEIPVCIMNSGYSSGWCEESFGIPLTAVEITCKAKGDDKCTFIMAPPHKIKEHLNKYVEEPELVEKEAVNYTIPSFFERKEVEKNLKLYVQHLKESEDFIQSIFEGAPDAVIITDTNGFITKWNQKAVSIFGWEKADVIGKRLLDIIVPEQYREMYQNEMNHFLKTGEGSFLNNAVEKFAVNKQGIVFPISLIISPVKIKEEIFLIGFFRDTTKQKKAEKFIQAIFDWAPDGIIVINSNGIVTNWNQKAETIFGWEIAEVIGKPLQEFINPIQYRESNKKWMEYFTKPRGESILNKNVDRIVVNKQGIQFPISMSISPIKIAEEIFLIGFFRDVTNRKKSEELLKEQKEQVRKLVEFQNIILNGTDYAIITTSDPDGIITSFNKGAENLLGYKADELVGKTSPAIIHVKSEVEAHAKLLSDELKIKVEPGIDVFHIKSRLGYLTDINEWTYIRKDGSLIQVELSISTLRDKDNKIIGYLGIAKDITDKKEAEKLLKEKNDVIITRNKEIIDSINYAKLIQQAILPKRNEIHSLFPKSFILFKPKDIVSGDFYYFTKNENETLIVAADCTGHGVPGAFMSIIGINMLIDSISIYLEPSEILKQLNIGIKKLLQQSANVQSTNDGMDVALCSINTESGMVKFAGANRPLWIIRKDQAIIEEIKGTKQSIGGYTEIIKKFKTHKVTLEKGDTLYIFSDGFADTFGGPNQKKIMTKKFKEILINIRNKSMEAQNLYLNNFIENWMKEIGHQTDDILVIGVQM